MLSRREIEQRLRALLADAALVQPDALPLDGELSRAGIDSLSMLRGIALIESEFAIVISDEEFEQMRTLAQLISVVERRMVADAA